MKKEEEKIDEYILFRCSCGDTEMKPPEFRKHLEVAHGLTGDSLKGSKRMVMHMDADKWFSSTYECTLVGGLTYVELIKLKRKRPFL